MTKQIWRRIAMALTVGLLALAAAGCRDAATAADGDGPATQPDTVIIVALQADGKTLDPHAAKDAGSKRLLENMYSSLFRYATTYGDVEPDLASSYSWNEDNTILTLNLVTNATFHSGRPVTAADVKYSIERMRDEGVQKAQFARITQIETPDDHTVRLHLEEPLAPLITWLADPMNAIVDREVVEANDGKLDRVDAGCGPFKLQEWRKDMHCKLIRHDGYHVDGLPKLDGITYRPIPDDTAIVTALRNGEVHMIFDVSAKTQRKLEKVDSLKVESVPGTFWEYLGLNTEQAPLDDVRVRQAIAHAVDREAINKLVKYGNATVLDGGHIPPGHWAHASDLHLYAQDDAEVAKARQLLEDAGIEQPLKLELKVGSDFAYQVQAAQIIKQQLKAINIDVTVTSMESTVFFDDLGSGDFQMTVVGWLGFVDPDEWTYNLFHSSGPFNQQGYANLAVDAWLDAGRRTTVRAERAETYRRIQEQVATDAPMVFLYANPRVTAMQPTVTGWVTHPTVSSIFLRDTSLAAE